MFIPIGDTPNPRGVPYVNYLLICTNVAVFVLVSLPLILSRPDLEDPLLLDYLRAIGARGEIPAQAILQKLSAYDLFMFRYGYRSADASAGDLFSAMFLHAGWLHLAGNMLFLWIFGDNVEHRLGRLGYLLAYVGAGVAATLFFAVFVPDSNVPMVGASGAISGVLGFYYLWFPRNQVRTFVFLFPFIMNTFLVPARIVLGFYLLIDNLLPFLINGGGGGGGVAHGAHIGGFVAGLGMAYGMERMPQRRRRPMVEAETGESGMGALGQPDASGVALALRDGDLKRAAALYFNLPGRAERRQLAAEDLLSIGEHLLQTGHEDAALTVFRRFIAERPADLSLDRACLGAGKALSRRPRSSIAAYHYFLAASDLARSREVAEEARDYLRAIERN